jgi:hypothetical protein
MAITLDGTTGITTPDITSSGSLNIDASAPDNSLVVNSSGNVGIGTSSPGARLDVEGAAASSNLAIKINNTDTSGYSTLQMGGTDAGIYRNGSTQGSYGGNSSLNIITVGAHPISFSTNNTLRATIDSSGNFKFNSGYGSAATAYGCRAWVNFNGTGTVAIRASGNVSSITDNGTGNYTVNFTTAMPDANYAATGMCNDNGNITSITYRTGGLFSTTQFQLSTVADGANLTDNANCLVSFFR